MGIGFSVVVERQYALGFKLTFIYESHDNQMSLLLGARGDNEKSFPCLKYGTRISAGDVMKL